MGYYTVSPFLVVLFLIPLVVALAYPDSTVGKGLKVFAQDWIWGYLAVVLTIWLPVTYWSVKRGREKQQARKKTELASAFPVPAPIKWWVGLNKLTKVSSTDAMFGDGEEGGYDLWLDARFQVNSPAKIDLLTMNILGETVQGQLVGASLLLRSQNIPVHILLPKQVCLDSPTVTPVALANGQEIPSENSVKLAFQG